MLNMITHRLKAFKHYIHHGNKELLVRWYESLYEDEVEDLVEEDEGLHEKKGTERFYQNQRIHSVLL